MRYVLTMLCEGGPRVVTDRLSLFLQCISLVFVCSVAASTLPTASVSTRPHLTLADGLANGGDPPDVVTVQGTAQISSTYTGPFGGSMAASASADGRFNQFKLLTDVSISDYGQGSFVDFYDFTVSNWLPAPVGASLRVDDVITLFGPDPTYDLAFRWDVSGTVSSTHADLVDAQLRFVMGFTGGQSDRLVSFGEDNRVWEETKTFVLRNVPSNTPVPYFYFAALVTWVKDCYYDTDKSYVCTAPPTYSASQRMDFGSTMTMTDFSIFRSNGDRALDVGYSTQNGLVFPGDVQAVPEPTTMLLGALGLALMGLGKVRGCSGIAPGFASAFRGLGLRSLWACGQGTRGGGHWVGMSSAPGREVSSGGGCGSPEGPGRR